MISAFHSVAPYRSPGIDPSTLSDRPFVSYVKSQAVCIAIPRIWLASFRIMGVHSSVGSLDNDWLQGIHISLLHVIISDMCIPCCGRYTTKDSEAPEILSYEEMLGVNISREPVLKIQM